MTRASCHELWLAFAAQDGVYDITDFIEQHPGGAKRIMLAAGGSVDSFWAMYAQHQKKEVADLLEGYRIGSLVRASCQLVPPKSCIALPCAGVETIDDKRWMPLH